MGWKQTSTVRDVFSPVFRYREEVPKENIIDYLLSGIGPTINPFSAGRLTTAGDFSYLVLMLGGISISLFYRRDMVYTVATIAGLGFIFLSLGSNVYPRHIAVLYPLFLVLIAQNLFFVKEKTSQSLYRLLPLITIFILLPGLMNVEPDSEGVNSAHYFISDYQEFDKLELSEPVATNHRRPYIYASFNDRNTLFIGPEGSNPIYDRIDIGGAKELYEEDEISLVILGADNCPFPSLVYHSSPCGYDTEDIVDKLNLDREEGEEVYLSTSHLVFTPD